MKWVLGKRVIDSFRFLFSNPLIFLIYLPITLLGLLSVYVSFETTSSTLIAIFYMALMLVFTSFIFTFLILKTAYYEMKKKISFKQNVDLSMKKFRLLLLAELIMIFAIIVFSSIINIFSLVWTSNFSIALLIVIAILFIMTLIKLFLFMPSCILRGGLGFKESWKIIKPARFLELAVLLAGYFVISSLLSIIPYIGYLIESLILGPTIIILLTMIYWDYLKKA
ncbi:MAG: hypothetical protein KKE23_00055 [Nanoarchaeota archaeon]|nr:hypothetical protein [Nanoarchaeota archaeon]